MPDNFDFNGARAAFQNDFQGQRQLAIGKAIDAVAAAVTKIDASETTDDQLSALNALAENISRGNFGQSVQQPKPAAPVNPTVAPSEDPGVKTTIEDFKRKLSEAESAKDKAEQDLETANNSHAEAVTQLTKAHNKAIAEKDTELSKSRPDDLRRIKALETWIEDFGKQTGVNVIIEDSGKPDITAVTRDKIIDAVKATVTPAPPATPAPTPTTPLPTIPADLAAFKLEHGPKLADVATLLVVNATQKGYAGSRFPKFTATVKMTGEEYLKLQQDLDAVLKGFGQKNLRELDAEHEASELAITTPDPA
jgi:hypothetical protein